MTIRLADIKDSEGISQVFMATLNMPTKDEALAAFESELASGHQFLVAEEDGQIIGLLSVILHGRPRHGLAELDHIAVLPSHRRQGIATKLFNESIKQLKQFYAQKGFKFRKYFLLTHADNLAAHSFYQKLGLKKEAVLKKHFYEDKDEFVYSLFAD